MLPSPKLLPKSAWQEYVLPRMGYFLGVYNGTSREELIESNAGGRFVEEQQIFPEEPLISEDDLRKLTDYYLDNAPDSLACEVKDLPTDLDFFKVVFPQMYLSPPSTTMVRFEKDGGLSTGDAHTKGLYRLDRDLEIAGVANVSEGIVHVHRQPGAQMVTAMGSFSPTDEPSGFIARLPVDPSLQATIAIRGLQRPVHAEYADMHGDGFEDIVVCEFGKWTGSLSLFQNVGDSAYTKHVLFNSPGAVRAYARDMNGDGRRDIIALFGQGNEGIDIFYNKGNNEFSRIRVLRFSPSHGSSFFNVYDFNEDGHLDVIYCAGDNADFKPVMKPYHGIYIYLNDGQNKFRQAFFHQLNGAYAAIPADFDLDGHIDIAAISFFPDWERSPEEGFVFLHNTGEGQFEFEALSFEGVHQGRWIVMDAGDLEGDGDLDLILGSLAFETIPDLGQVQRWSRNGIPFLVLENMTR